MDRVAPSQELTTSNCPSPSRSAKNASSGSSTSPTVTAGQRSLRPSTPGLRYTRTSPPCSQGEAMSSNPSPSKSPKRTPSAPNEESSIVWRGQAPSGHSTVSESLGPQWIEGTTRMHQLAKCERRRVGIFGCSLLRWGPILPTRDDSTTPAHGFKTIRPVGSVRCHWRGWFDTYTWSPWCRTCAMPSRRGASKPPASRPFRYEPAMDCQMAPGGSRLSNDSRTSNPCVGDGGPQGRIDP